MEFSVLMSVYKKDKPEFLKIALESVYNSQTLKPNEFVLVFDGPLTEELYRVVNEFEEDKKELLKIVRLDENKGLGNALKEGTKFCSNELIFRMDSDDISDPKRFEKQIKFMIENPDVDCLGTYIAEFENFLAEKKKIRIVHEKHKDIVKMARRRNPMNHVSVCMRKSALESCGGYEEIKLLEDYYLWLKMIVGGYKLANIPEPLVYVRVGNGFHSKRGDKQRIKGWKQLQDYMIKHDLISTFEAWKNMIYINVFINTPSFLKKIVYTKFLRK